MGKSLIFVLFIALAFGNVFGSSGNTLTNELGRGKNELHQQPVVSSSFLNQRPQVKLPDLKFFCHEKGCCQQFVREEDFRNHHQKDHQQKDPRYCPWCSCTFSDDSTFKWHTMDQHPAGGYLCTVGGCGGRFKNNNALRKHQKNCFSSQRIVVGKPQHSCSECEKCFENRQILVQHIKKCHFDPSPTILPKVNVFKKNSILGVAPTLSSQLSQKSKMPELAVQDLVQAQEKVNQTLSSACSDLEFLQENGGLNSVEFLEFLGASQNSDFISQTDELDIEELAESLGCAGPGLIFLSKDDELDPEEFSQFVESSHKDNVSS